MVPDFHNLRVENIMPTPPEYETTHKVYFYLLDHTELDGRVPVPLRRIAKDMGRAWSHDSLAHPAPRGVRAGFQETGLQPHEAHYLYS